MASPSSDNERASVRDRVMHYAFAAKEWRSWQSQSGECAQYHAERGDSERVGGAMNHVAVDSILVVDDTPTNSNNLVAAVSGDGYRVVVTNDGQSALEQTRQAMPIAILMHAIAPRPEAYEACRRLKSNADTAEIPVIFVTVSGDSSDKAKGFAAGGSDFMIEPFEREELLARVKSHVRTHKHQLQSSHVIQELQARLAERTAELSAAREEIARLKAIQELDKGADGPASNGGNLHTLQEMERRHFVAALTRTHGVIEGPRGVARMLDLKPSTARFRIRKLGIRREDFVAR
jgi:CheY-like chemotaxis protein